jgi:hypothetical protein
VAEQGLKLVAPISNPDPYHHHPTHMPYCLCFMGYLWQTEQFHPNPNHWYLWAWPWWKQAPCGSKNTSPDEIIPDSEWVLYLPSVLQKKDERFVTHRHRDTSKAKTPGSSKSQEKGQPGMHSSLVAPKEPASQCLHFELLAPRIMSCCFNPPRLWSFAATILGKWILHCLRAQKLYKFHHDLLQTIIEEAFSPTI